MIKHALDHAFHWENHKGPFRLISEDQARQFDEQGFRFGSRTFIARSGEITFAPHIGVEMSGAAPAAGLP